MSERGCEGIGGVGPVSNRTGYKCPVGNRTYTDPFTTSKQSYELERLLRAGVRVLLIDLLAPGRHDPRGMHAAVWARFDRRRYRPPEGGPLTLASYRWDEQDREPEAFIEPMAVGSALVPVPLFLDAKRYVGVPLEATYAAAFGAMPQVWREVLEATPSGSPLSGE